MPIRLTPIRLTDKNDFGKPSIKAASYLQVRPCKDNKTEHIANNANADDDVSDHTIGHKLDLHDRLGSWVGAEDEENGKEDEGGGR